MLISHNTLQHMYGSQRTEFWNQFSPTGCGPAAELRLGSKCLYWMNDLPSLAPARARDEGPGFDWWYLSKEPGGVAGSCNPGAGDVVTSRPLELDDQPQVSGKGCLKK